MVKSLADAVDARLLLTLAHNSRLTIIALAERHGLSRNTVNARLTKLEESGALGSIERRIDPAALGFPLTAYVLTTVKQRKLTVVETALAEIPEVLEVQGLSGDVDLLIKVVGRDAPDLYRIAGQILATDGVKRTRISLVIREMVDYRITPLLRTVAQRTEHAAPPRNRETS